jgi:hypothetical protein
MAEIAKESAKNRTDAGELLDESQHFYDSGYGYE